MKKSDEKVTTKATTKKDSGGVTANPPKLGDEIEVKAAQNRVVLNSMGNPYSKNKEISVVVDTRILTQIKSGDLVITAIIGDK